MIKLSFESIFFPFSSLGSAGERAPPCLFWFGENNPFWFSPNFGLLFVTSSTAEFSQRCLDYFKFLKKRRNFEI